VGEGPAGLAYNGWAGSFVSRVAYMVLWSGGMLTWQARREVSWWWWRWFGPRLGAAACPAACSSAAGIWQRGASYADGAAAA
jgi:hypothetical protein